MKKFLKFKEADGLLKLSKNKYFSKEEREKINLLLKKEFYDLNELSEKLNLFNSKENSIKVKYLRYKDLRNKLSKKFYISKDSINKHFVGFGTTGLGKTIKSKELLPSKNQELTHFRSPSEEGYRKLMDSLIELAVSEYCSGHLFPERAIPPKDIVIFEEGK